MRFIYIITVLLIIYLVYLFNKSNKLKEHLNTESVNNIFGLCYDASGNVNYSNFNISGGLQFKTKMLKDYMVDRIYPVGSFYVQYPNKNTNDPDEAFPEALSPAKLFGGTWQEQWGNESIFFRTLGPHADENRINGFQDYAIAPLYGHTSYVQTDRAAPGNGSDGIFSQYETMRIGTDGGNGDSPGHRNYFDSSTQAKSSKFETRSRNRLIKVWKRVNLLSNKTMPPLPPNKFDDIYDNIYYEGPYPHNTYVSGVELPNAKTVDDAKKACNENYNCMGIGLQNKKYYMSFGGLPVYNKYTNTGTIWYKRKNNAILETNNDASSVKTKTSEFSSLPV
jgi:hypothetical protein